MADYTDIDKLRELEAAATPGPWKLWAMDVLADPVGDSNLDTALLVARTFSPGTEKLRTFNAQLIAQSRNALPSLLAELVGLRTEVDQLRGENAERARAEWHPEYQEALDELDALQAERDTLFRQVYDRGHEADTLMDRALAAESDLAALQARIDAAYRKMVSEVDPLRPGDKVKDQCLAILRPLRALGVDPQKETGE